MLRLLKNVFKIHRFIYQTIILFYLEFLISKNMFENELFFMLYFSLKNLMPISY